MLSTNFRKADKRPVCQVRINFACFELDIRYILKKIFRFEFLIAAITNQFRFETGNVSSLMLQKIQKRNIHLARWKHLKLGKVKSVCHLT